MKKLCTALILLLVCIFQTRAIAQQNAATAKPAEKKAVEEERSTIDPNINKNFLDPEMDVQQWVERFEVESREVYHARDEIMSRMRLKPGMRVADIGAGTGFYTLLMAKAVGDQGWAYAVELSPKFVEYLTETFHQRGVTNVTTVKCNEVSVCLPPESIDAAFICDVYHHFEYPEQTMTSLFDALTSDGRLFLIDFERIPGVSREWMLSHVRAGKQTFIDEIQSVGFELVAERIIPEFKENYFLEFRKP